MNPVLSSYDQPPWDYGHEYSGKPDPGKDTESVSDSCNDNPCFKGSPVFLLDGNYRYSSHDILIPGIIPLELNRVYNSRDNIRNGIFGYGWVFNYDYAILEVEDNDTSEIKAIVLFPDGRRIDFIKNPDNTYTGPPYIFMTLSFENNHYLLRHKHGTIYKFKSNGKLISITDRNDNNISISYSNGVISTVSDDSGRTLDFVYGPNGKLSTITDPANRVFTYEYDSNGDLITYIDPMGYYTVYTYDNDHNMLSIDVEGKIYESISYYSGGTSNGKVNTYIDPNGEIWTYYYIDASTVSKVDSSNNTWTYKINDKGAITKVTDPLGFFLSREYDENTLKPSSYTNKNSNIYYYEYDNNVNLKKEIDPLGNEIEYTYEPNYNLLESITDANENTTLFTYDTNGNMVKITDALNNNTILSYYSNGLLESKTDSLGNTYSYEYDDYGNLSILIDPLLNKTIINNDILGNIVSITDPTGNITNYLFDDLGHLTKVTDALNHDTIYNYDENGNIVSTVDANGIGPYYYTYDNHNNVILDPYGNNYNWKNGNLTFKIDANSNKIDFTYDPIGRLIIKTYEDGNYVNYSYDGVGNIVQIYDSQSHYEFEYDKANRLTEVQEKLLIGKSISYTYDKAGNRTNMIDTDGQNTSYEYNSLNGITKIYNPYGEVTEYYYNEIGLVSLIHLPNAVDALIEYDSCGNLEELLYRKTSGQVLFKYEYDYDGCGNRKSLTYLGGGLETYEYDQLGQLKKVVYEDGSFEEFLYDNIGNRMKLTTSSSVTDYEYTNGPYYNMTKAGNIQYNYYLNGNVKNKTDSGLTTTFEYDYENNLLNVTYSDGTSSNFMYSPHGKRILTEDKSGNITKYFYDEYDVLSELSNNSTTITRYTSGIGTDDMISMKTNDENSLFFIYDGLGSVRGLLDDSSNTVNSYSYKTFGSIMDQSVNQYNPYLFTGRVSIDSTDLYYYRSRYYDSVIGRYSSLDKFRGYAHLPLSLNLSIYVSNNPATHIDPFGFTEECDPFQECMEKCMEDINKVSTVLMITSLGKGLLQSGKIDIKSLILGGVKVSYRSHWLAWNYVGAGVSALEAIGGGVSGNLLLLAHGTFGFAWGGFFVTMAGIGCQFECDEYY